MATSASDVAVSERPIRPALALDSISRISFILAYGSLETLRQPGPDRPMDYRIAMGSRFGNWDNAIPTDIR